jgi:ribosomal protein S20
VPDLLKFSMQVSMLNQLLSKGLITEKEHAQIKSRLTRDYKILSPSAENIL